MPICPDCRVAYMEGEGHSCAVSPSTVSRLLPSQWSRRRSLMVFGIVAGLAWGMTPLVLYGFRMDLLRLAVAAGPITGIVMTFAMEKLLRDLSPGGAVAVGIFAIPVGVLVFATMRWTADFLAYQLLSGTRPPAFGPLDAGIHDLLGLVYIWPATVLATPAAVLTTFQLRGLAVGRK